MDLFIAEEEYLNKGYGTAIVKLFCQKIIQDFGAKKILIDPASNNQCAIRCYEKSGFTILKMRLMASQNVALCSLFQMSKITFAYRFYLSAVGLIIS